MFDRLIGRESRLFANGPGDRVSIPGRVIPKTLKMLLDTFLLNTQHYEVRIKGKVEQSRERSSTLLHLGVVAIEKGAFRSPSTTVTIYTFTYFDYNHNFLYFQSSITTIFFNQTFLVIYHTYYLAQSYNSSFPNK